MSDVSDSLIQALPDLTIVVRSDGVIVGNIGGKRLGIAGEPGELIGSSLRQIWTEDIANHLSRLVRRTLRTRATVDRHYHHQGRHFQVRVQPYGVDRVMMVLRDVSSETAASAAQPILSEADSIALEKRAAFEQRLESTVTMSRLREIPLSVAAIHLGGLRDARNTLGPAECSRLVGAVLTRLQSPAPLPGDTRPYLSPFGRLRSDLLMVLFIGMRERKTVAEAAERIRRALAEPLVDGERRVQLRPTLGVARFPDDGSTAELLLEGARAALSTARYSDHDSTITFCSRTLAIPQVNHADFEQEMRWALERGQLQLHYQPILDLKTRETLAFEALIRWIHPVCGEMVPDQFLPVAARSQLGRDIDEWALKHACADLVHLPHEGAAPVRIEVNIGQRMLESEMLATTLTACAAAARVELSQVGLNISERVLSTSRSALHCLRELRERGMKVFIDGFGSGRVPLERLASLPIDGIGIDRATIARIPNDAPARALCQSVVSIAHAFELRATAAGVETQQQLEFLTKIGCDAAQGQLLCAPAAIQSFRPADDKGASLPMARVSNSRRS
jgi:EAL domain-containing protein (putative c-di-GMP-specific phosphodiesterase class I)/GGDEF domain-containing protein